MIEYLSDPLPVSMGEQWFEIAAMDHFWIVRRYHVLRALGGAIIRGATEIAEVGCGNGLLQRQIEMGYARNVTGLDLNEYALKRNVSTRSRVCCYDIRDRNPEFAGSFDLIFLFDVLEHISDEHGFLEALLFHLGPNGKIIINVPAGQWAFSSYDRTVGHVRRYDINSLRNTARQAELTVSAWTYWGLPLMPMLAIRKIWLTMQRARDSDLIIRKGFDTRAPWLNEVLALLSRCEPIPQKVIGSSLMAIMERFS